MDRQRPVLEAKRTDRGENADDDAAPSTQRKATLFVDKDETLGLTRNIANALDLASESAELANDARDANDEELAEFFELCQTECALRAERGKTLLEDRLRHESDQRAAQPHRAEHGRIHYVSSPDEDPESVR